jgi:hypothetical protein
VLYDGRVELVLAEDVTTATEYLLDERFDAMIVDVRLPPGDNEHWKKLYREAGRDKVHAELGLQLLRWLLGETPSNGLPRAPDWVEAKRVGVFSVERKLEILDTLETLGISVVQQKRADLPDTILRDLIEQLLDSE